MAGRCGSRASLARAPPFVLQSRRPPVNKRSEVRLLLVEDDPAHVALTLAAIKRANDATEGRQLTTTIARDGEEALSLLQGTYRPDIILLDLRMPKLSGR